MLYSVRFLPVSIRKAPDKRHDIISVDFISRPTWLGRLLGYREQTKTREFYGFGETWYEMPAFRRCTRAEDWALVSAQAWFVSTDEAPR